MNRGSGDSFSVCTTCGLRPNVRQIRDTHGLRHAR
jgi:hypothetical protein